MEKKSELLISRILIIGIPFLFLLGGSILYREFFVIHFYTYDHIKDIIYYSHKAPRAVKYEHYEQLKINDCLKRNGRYMSCASPSCKDDDVFCPAVCVAACDLKNN